ncbi:MAG: YbhB/YbcL family Raf kinase inhibitor-like protein [Verrucomicrobia bacterium]|nr:YbhB/YbcL family Raf kinase inhibitor-like protein [Verrucomicrobiota bacterium]
MHAAGSGSGFRVTSPVLAEGGVFRLEQVYNGSGCHGKNASPELHWTTPSKAAQGFAVTMFDPDAGGGHGWWHWVIFNLPPQTRTLAAGAGTAGSRESSTPGIRQARNDFGDVGYSGPCPPQGDRAHRYVITVYALDVPALGNGQSTTPEAAAVAAQLERHALAKATLTAKFGR